jgi:hypothetical protein
MVEGRNISTRRHASVEYMSRVSKLHDQMSLLQERVKYYECRDDVVVSTRRHPDAKSLFIVKLNNNSHVVYDEQRRLIEVCPPDTTDNRSVLRALETSLKMSTPHTRIYVDSDYLNDMIRRSLDRWMHNGYKLTSGESIKNLDLIRNLVTLKLDMSNVYPLTRSHDAVVRYIRDSYYKLTVEPVVVGPLEDVERGNTPPPPQDEYPSSSLVPVYFETDVHRVATRPLSTW